MHEALHNECTSAYRGFDDAYEYTVDEAFGQRAEEVRRQIEKTAGLRKQER
jgi:hypothetical protein